MILTSVMKAFLSRSLLLLVSFAAAESASAQFWGGGDLYSDGTLHDLDSGELIEIVRDEYDFVSGLPSDSQSVSAVGNTGAGHASFTASPGVLKVFLTGSGHAFEDRNGQPHFGGGGGNGFVAFEDRITINESGIYEFRWNVNGTGARAGDAGFHGDGRMYIQNPATFEFIGNFMFNVSESGAPMFTTPSSVMRFLTAGTQLAIGGSMHLFASARGNNLGSGTALLDYGNSAYTEIRPIGAGSFSSASGYSYAPVPEPATMAVLGLGVASLLRRRRGRIGYVSPSTAGIAEVKK